MYVLCIYIYVYVCIMSAPICRLVIPFNNRVQKPNLIPCLFINTRYFSFVVVVNYGALPKPTVLESYQDQCRSVRVLSESVAHTW